MIKPSHFTNLLKRKFSKLSSIQKKLIYIYLALILLTIIGVIWVQYQQYRNKPRVFTTQINSVKTDAVLDDKDDGWTLTGKTNAPDGSLIAVYDPKSKDKDDVVNFDYGPVKNSKFKVNVSGNSVTDNHSVDTNESIPVSVMALSNVKLKDSAEPFKIPKEVLKNVQTAKSNAKLKVNNDIQTNAAKESSMTQEGVTKTLEDAQKAQEPQKNLSDEVNSALSTKLKQRKKESNGNRDSLDYIASMKYMKTNDGTMGVRIDFTDTKNLSNNDRYEIAFQGQHIARQALNSMQSESIIKKFDLTYDNGHMPFIEAGDKGNIAYVSDPSTHVIIH